MNASQTSAKAIFLQALELTTATERAAYVKMQCGSNADLRREVEALLAEHQQLGSFMEANAAVATLDRTVTERPNAQIGPYKLLQQIGEGGMGVVYMAEQTEPVERRVALKIIKPGMDTRQVIARFEAERQALAMMDHPNIARVLDAGQTASGRPYFVMELVKGLPVTQYCDEHRLSPRERLELFVPICHAVQHAHQKGIIHRDLKPSNILIAQYDNKPVAKVIDFGVAKAIGQKMTERTMFTQSGQIVGTIEYMSPEQAQFNQLDIDTRSDIYSLGVLLYELLTGCTPFDGKRLRSAAFDEMLRIIREEEPPKPSTRLSSVDTLPSIAASRHIEPARLSRTIRGELDWIVMKALEKDRNRRYETANGFAQDLHRYLNDEPVVACPPSAAYRFRKFARRNQGGLAVAVLMLFFLMLLGSIVGWAVRDRAATAHQISTQRAERRARREQKITQLLDEIDLHYRGGQHSEAMASVRQAEAVLADGETNAELKQRLARWRADLEMIAQLEKIRLERATLSEDGKWDTSGADRAYQQAFRQYGLEVDARELEQLTHQLSASPIAVELAIALDDWASVRQQLPSADDAAWRSLVAAAQIGDPEPLRNRLRSLWGRKVAETRGEIEQLAASLPGQKLHPTTVVLAARVLRNAALQTEAEVLLREGQERYPGDFWINFELGLYLSQQPWEKWEKLTEAPGFYRAAVAVRPGNALVHSNLGFAWARLHRAAQAEQAHREAIRLSPHYGRAHLGLGMLYRDQGKWPEAIAAFEDAIRAEPETSYSYPELAKILTNCPDLTQRDYRRARDVAGKGAQLAPQSTLELQFLGWAEYREGDWQAAINALEKSCELQRNPAVGDAYQWFFLAMANYQLGRKEEARRWYEKSFLHTEIWNDEVRRMQAEAGDLLGIASPPEQFFVSLAQARTHRDEKRWQEAIDAYSQAINLAPIQAAVTWHSRGIAYLELKQWEPAFQDLTRSLEIAPQHNWGWHRRGRALAGLGQLDRAIADFTKAVELNPQDWGAVGNRGLAHIKLNQLDEAVADFTSAVALAPGRNWLWQNRADAHALRGAWDQALSDYAQAVRCEPGADVMWRRYFDCCAKAGQWERAAAECDRSLTALPKVNNPWQQDSKVFHIAAERQEIYERLCKLRPADRALRIARARLLLRQGAGQQASAVLAEVIDLAPADHWSWYLQAILCLDSGAVEEYRRVCREMLGRFAQSPDPFVAERTAKACFLAAGAVEDLGTAQQLAQRAVAVHSGNRGFRLAQALGEYRAGRFESAIERLQGCLDPVKESPCLAETAWLVRGLAEHQLQRTDDARNSFAKAQELFDQGPQREQGPLTDTWAENRRLDLLFRETKERLALGNSAGQAFVVARGNPVVERRFLTLAAAVANTKDGDTIEIRGNGPFYSIPIAIGNRRLTIRAGEGFRPAIQFDVNSNANKGALLTTNAALVLEGIELRDGGLAEPPPQFASVVSSNLAPLFAANCRFLVKNQRAIQHNGGPVCQVRNCEFLGKPLLGFRCDAGQSIVIDNNLIPRAADVPIISVQPPCENISIRLTRNSLQGNAAIQFYFHQTPLWATGSDQGRVAPVQIESTGNIFDIFHFGTQFGFDLADGIQPEEAKAGLRRIVAWNQQGDLFSLRTGRAAKIRANRKNGERFDAALFSLEEWKQFWGQPEGVVIGGTVQYQGGDLPHRAEASPEQLTPEDFRLREGSAGYRAGPDGKDLGPDIDLVGPGPGYERWKKTPVYQQWLTDTKQVN